MFGCYESEEEGEGGNGDFLRQNQEEFESRVGIGVRIMLGKAEVIAISWGDVEKVEVDMIYSYMGSENSRNDVRDQKMDGMWITTSRDPSNQHACKML